MAVQRDWRIPGVIAILAIFVLITCEIQQSWADERQKPELQRKTDFRFTSTDVTGRVRLLQQRHNRDALVIVFLSTECPIANGYLPTLNRLHQQWQKHDHDTEFYGVISDRSVTRSAAAKHSREFQITFPVLFDASGELSDWLKPTHTPEAFVIGSSGDIAYRGRINDLYADLGKRKIKVTQNDLADAVTAIVAGRVISKKRTKPVGCLVETLPANFVETQVTYNRDISPIIHANCISCHRKGEVSPFPLTSYKEVAKRARQIASVTQTRFMPPWKPDRSLRHFHGERGLTDRQIKLLSAWAKAKAPEGDVDDLPPQPEFTTGWQLGTPDLIVKMPEKFQIPADGPDIFQNFVIPLNLDEDHFCVAAEFRPGNRRVVHHTIFYLDHRGIARKRDQQDPDPGYRTFGGPGFLPTGGVGGWSPGTTARVLQDNMARYIKKGSDLVMQVHYHPSGKTEIDQSTIGLYFTEKPKNIVASITLGDLNFSIPPGENNHRVTTSYTLSDDVTMYGATPHMHLLGKSMEATATLADGKVLSLIRIKDWNFYWQDLYLFDQPLALPKGTRIDVEAHFDNSANNPLNPHSPPKIVRYGEQTTDEMCYCFFLVATKTPQDLRPLIFDNVKGLARQRLEKFFKSNFGGSKK